MGSPKVSVDPQLHTLSVVPRTEPRAPVFVGLFGRQRIGKSSTAWALSHLWPKDRTVQVWDFDPAALQEDGRTLSWLLPAALKPSKADDQARLEWLREGADAQIGATLDGRPFDVICDFGGIEEMLKRFAGKFQFVQALEEFGVEVMAVHVIGPDPADLRFLREVESSGTFKPKRAAIVMNEAMIGEDQGAAEFAGVVASPVVREFVARKGVVCRMPRLFQMPRIAGPGGVLEKKWQGKAKDEPWASIPLQDFGVALTGLGHLDARQVRIWLNDSLPVRLRDLLP